MSGRRRRLGKVICDRVFAINPITRYKEPFNHNLSKRFDCMKQIKDNYMLEMSKDILPHGVYTYVLIFYSFLFIFSDHCRKPRLGRSSHHILHIRLRICIWNELRQPRHPQLPITLAVMKEIFWSLRFWTHRPGLGSSDHCWSGILVGTWYLGRTKMTTFKIKLS